jgi:hypothetical protein
VATLYDRSPDSTPTARAIARVIHKDRPDRRFPVMDSNVFVIEDGLVPLVESIGGPGYMPGIAVGDLVSR